MTIFDFIHSLFHLFIFYSFFTQISQLKKFIKLKKRNLFILAIFYIILLSEVYILKYILNQDPFYMLLINFILFLLFSNMFEITLTERFVYSSVLTLSGVIAEFTSSLFIVNFTNIYEMDFTQNDLRQFFIMFITQIIFLFISKIFSFFFDKSEYKLKFAYWIVLLFIPILSILQLLLTTFIASKNNYSDHYIILILLIITFSINIFVFLIFNYLTYHYNQEQIKNNEIIYLNNEKRRYKEIIDFSEKLAQLAHDFNKHLKTIRFFIDKKEFDDCINYMDAVGIKNNSIIIDDYYFISNKAANTVLNMKIREAEEKGIKVETDASVFRMVPILDIDLCIIIGNAMDNAINACVKCSGDKYIMIKITEKDNKLLVSIKNSANEFNIVYENSIEVEKQYDIFKGHGLNIIKETVERYNGFYQINCKENLFILDIMFFLDY